jgi:hypothetical protein
LAFSRIETFIDKPRRSDIGSPLEQDGAIETLRISGRCVAAGGGFDKI